MPWSDLVQTIYASALFISSTNEFDESVPTTPTVQIIDVLTEKVTPEMCGLYDQAGHCTIEWSCVGKHLAWSGIMRPGKYLLSNHARLHLNLICMFVTLITWLLILFVKHDVHSGSPKDARISKLSLKKNNAKQEKLFWELGRHLRQ